MDIHEIREAIMWPNGLFPREALEEAVQRREEVVPVLLSIIETAGEHPEQMVSQDDGDVVFGPVFAMLLLAQFREKQAYPLITTMARLPQDTLDSLLGDSLTEHLGRVLASVCDGDTGLIKSLIEDSGVGEYVRGSAVEALKILVAKGKLERDDVMRYYHGLLIGTLERSHSQVWNALVSCAVRLHPLETHDAIMAAFDEGLVDPGYISAQSVTKIANMDRDKVLTRLREASEGYIEDTIAETHWWACFNRDKYASRKKPVSEAPKMVKPVQSAATQVGPNEPCTCGSGRKYKKCCGRLA